METPATIRRNPPRKAKLSSIEKSTVKECRSSRKRYVAEAKTLMPSFAAAEADGNPSLKHTEEAITQPENLELDSALQKSCDYTTEAGTCDLQHEGSMNHTHACVTESFHESSGQPVDANFMYPMNVAELGRSNSVNAEENITITSILSIEAEKSQLETPFARSTTKQASGRLRVFLRIRPAKVARAGKLTGKALKIVNKSVENAKRPRDEKTSCAPDVCLQSQTSDCVTLVTPATFLASHKPKSEEFSGFSRIFNPDSTQRDVFNEILAPRLVDLLDGKSSVVVAMGPTSAGKTHTMLGTPEDPGLLPQSVQYLFDANLSQTASSTMRVVLSMFEIYSEQGGRFEKILDLLRDGAELSLQQSKLKSLHEVIASSVEEANTILLNGLQKRTTASTAANHQSSRSHCIINMSVCHVKHLMSADALKSSKQGTLTVADLAGFEREKKTKNQGARLNESGFINNTSMVFGQCLRALLEHQKNPKKALQRHFQYSMLTRYLKPYMEAKGDMTLMVNVSPCEEDYLDTAFVLRQVAPYSSIKLNLQPSQAKDIGAELAVEKRAHSWKEMQPLMRKRRKLGGAANASVNLPNCSNIAKSIVREEVLNTMADEGDGHQRSAEKLPSCQMEAVGGIVGEAREPSGKSNQIKLGPNPTDELTATFLAEVNNVLVEEGVENSDRVSLAVIQIFNPALKHYHRLQDLEGQLQQRHAEITLLSTNLIKEQENAYALLRELETWKSNCESLEKQLSILDKSSHPDDVKHSGPLASTKVTSPSEQTVQNIVEGQALAVGCQIHDDNSVMPIVRACSTSNLTKNPDAHHMSDQSVRFSLVSPSMDNNCAEVKEFEDLNAGKTVPMVLSSMDIICTEVREFEDLNVGKTVPAPYECLQTQVPDMCVKNTLATLGTCNEQTKELQFCESEDERDLDSSAMPPNERPERSNSELFPSPQNRAMEGGMACQPALEVTEYCNLQRSDDKSSQILQLNLFPRHSEASVKADEDLVNFQKKNEKCMSVSMTIPDTDCSSHTSDLETCHSEEYLKLEQCRKTQASSVQKLLSSQEGHITFSTAVEKPSSPHLYKEGKVSNLQKGKMLAFSLMQESIPAHEMQSNHDLLSVHPPLHTDVSVGTIGAIGQDLEELLKIPLSEIEKELWTLEAAPCSGSSDLRSRCSDLLGINKLFQKYSQQRAYCIRYCLAVICGKMSVDGKWMPLAKETMAPRKSHFYAVIQARTVTEAAGHARAGLLLETLSQGSMADIQKVDRADAGEKASEILVEAVDNKENRNCSPMSTKAKGPLKRRKLQPLSSLSLQADPHMCPDFDFTDASAEDVHPSKPTNKANSLADLLSHQNR